MKKRMTSTPHDAVFKRFLRHPETANDFLTWHLPEAIRQRCYFSTLRLEPASFVDEDLRAWYSDVLWSVQSPLRPEICACGGRLEFGNYPNLSSG